MISDEKFRKAERLIKSGDFRKVYNNGRSVKSGAVVLYYMSNGMPVSRIGFSISSKSVRLAVKRNRIRRILRESFRRNKGSLKGSVDIVISIRRQPAIPVASKDIRGLFLELARKAGIL